MNKNLRSSVVGSEIWEFGRMFSVPGFPPFSLYDIILQNLVSILVSRSDIRSRNVIKIETD